MPKARRVPDSERTTAMRAALHAKWGQKSQGDARRHAVIEQVPHAPGFHKELADACVMNLWTTDGLRLIGYELKASRGDLKHELSTPEKTAKVRALCDEWWLLVYDMAVLHGLDTQIPAAWGIAVMQGDGESAPYTIRTYRKPGFRRRVPDPLVPRSFVAAMVRRALEHAPTAAYVADIVERTRYQARAAGKEDGEEYGRAEATQELWQFVWETLGDLGTVKPQSPVANDKWGRRHTNESALAATVANLRVRLAEAEAALRTPARSA